jgi:hypothetical protein
MYSMSIENGIGVSTGGHPFLFNYIQPRLLHQIGLRSRRVGDCTRMTMK